MSDIAISVKELGKKYLIRHQRETHRYKTVREALAGKLTSLFHDKDSIAPAIREEFWALKEVSFDIKQGEAVGIIGRNGAGKSTLLKLLSRITEPSTGSIDLHGRVASLLEVGTGFHQELTGRENIYLNGSILGMSRMEVRSKFDEIVAFAEVEKFLDTPVKRYSSGMYMRLAFAVAAHLEPEILIVDEVLAVGDAAFQKRCLGKMGQVTSSGRTVLFVSHQINAIEQLCSRVIQLDSGRIKADSRDIREVTQNYLFGGTDAETKGVASWKPANTSTSNPYFSPEEFYLGNRNGDLLTMPVSNESEIWIYLKARVENPDPSLTIGCAIYAESGELLFWSYQTDTDSENWPSLSKGENILKTRMPSHFLNEGIYRIELIGGLHHREWLFPPGNSPAISLNIQGGLSSSPLWTAKRPGLLAPILPWTI
ncbi:MAG: ABC transporter ATP-binding protein [Chthoniobacterales bacterium]